MISIGLSAIFAAFYIITGHSIDLTVLFHNIGFSLYYLYITALCIEGFYAVIWVYHFFFHDRNNYEIEISLNKFLANFPTTILLILLSKEIVNTTNIGGSILLYILIFIISVFAEMLSRDWFLSMKYSWSKKTSWK